MEYNRATFWPTTNTKQGDINSLNANFNLVQWSGSNLEQFELLLSLWTPYEKAENYEDEEGMQTALYNSQNGLNYHQGIIYNGVGTDQDEDYKTINLFGDETSIRVKPGSIVYTIDTSLSVADPQRFLIIENPVKKGYNETIKNGTISFTFDTLNTGKRPIKGPTGASNWNVLFTFNELRGHHNADLSQLLKFRIPLTSINAKNLNHPLTYSNQYSIKFYIGNDFLDEIIIPHQTWIGYEEDSINHAYIYYVYITFNVTSNAQGKALFNNENISTNYKLLIW